jgi:hypothetical protein
MNLAAIAESDLCHIRRSVGGFSYNRGYRDNTDGQYVSSDEMVQEAAFASLKSTENSND